MNLVISTSPCTLPESETPTAATENWQLYRISLLMCLYCLLSSKTLNMRQEYSKVRLWVYSYCEQGHRPPPSPESTSCSYTFQVEAQAGCDRQPSSRWERNSWHITIERVTDRILSTVPISHGGLTTNLLCVWEEAMNHGKMKFKKSTRGKNSKYARRLKILSDDSAEFFTHTQRLH